MTWQQVRIIVYILMLTVVVHYGAKVGWRLVMSL